MIGMVRGVITLLLMALFISLVVWAWGSGRKASFERAARMPLDDDSELSAGSERS